MLVVITVLLAFLMMVLPAPAVAPAIVLFCVVVFMGNGAVGLRKGEEQFVVVVNLLPAKRTCEIKSVNLST